jgi:peptide/nickel transport system permease protein
MDALRQAFGFNDGSLLSQYATYLAHVIRGDLGTSIAYYPAAVSDVMGTGLQWTLVLAGVSLVMSFTTGTLLGIVAAWRRGGWFDTAVAPVLVLLGAFPYFWLAMALLFAFGFGLGWFPVRHAYGASSPGVNLEFVLDAARHAVLPAASIVIATVGGWMLAMRNNMVAVLRADFITMAWAKGLSSRTVMLRYAARSALLPSVTGFGNRLRISGARLSAGGRGAQSGLPVDAGPVSADHAGRAGG